METVTVILAAMLKLFSLYFVGIALFAVKPRPPRPQAAPRTRFACLIAARNEEAVIGALVESLTAQHYPAALFDIYVAPNQCTDRTEEAARSAGARILHGMDPVHCKGDVLHKALQVLHPMDYDAFCIFDADNVVDPEFLARMNDAFCAGAYVAKSRIAAKNPGQSGISGCYAVYHEVFNHLFNQGRENLGLSARLVGTGFALHRNFLEQCGGWNTETMTEDAEFAAKCALLGERVWYVPEAVTYDEAPVEFGASLHQRLRWCAGIMDNARRYAKRLFRALSGTAAWLALDELLLLLAPYVQALGLLLAPLTLFVMWRSGMSPVWLLFSLLLPLLGSMLLASVTVLARRLPCRWQSVLLFPLFMFSWLPLQWAALLCPPRSWKPISHGMSAVTPAE